MRDQKWAVQAKQAGYPLCSDCQEPLVRERWGQRQCLPCELGTRRVLERRRDDEEIVRRRRQFGVE